MSNDWKTWFMENGGKHITDAYQVPVCNDHGTFLFHRMTINEAYQMFKARMIDEMDAKP